METDITRRGNFFEIHDVVGQKVTQLRKLGVSKKGYEGKTQEVQVLAVTVPVFDESGESVLTALRYDFPETDSSKEKGKHLTALFIPGGAGEAIGNVDMLVRLIDSLGEIRNQLPFDINRIIVLPHVVGSVRTNDIDRETGKSKDVGRQPTMTKTASILIQTTKGQEHELSNELKLSNDGVVIFGYSLGGLLGTEIAAQLGNQCKFLIPMDPVGYAEHQNLLYEFGPGTVRATLEKYTGIKGTIYEIIIKAIREGKGAELLNAWREMRIAWGAVGNKLPNPIDMVKDSLPGKKADWALKLGKAYGIDKREMAGTGPHTEPATHEIAAEVRKKVKAAIVYSPIEGAKLALATLQNLAEKYPTSEAILTASRDDKRRKELEESVIDMMKSLFPQSKAIFYAGYPDITHSAVRVEDGYWKKVMDVFLEASKQLF